MKTVPQLSHEEAHQLIQIAKTKLEEKDLGAAVAVVDPHGELMAFLRTDTCPLPSINNAINKAFTSAREKVDSVQIGKASRNDPFPMTNFGDLRYTGWGGGVVIIQNGQVLGAMGISGLPEADDMALAKETLAAFLKQSV